MRSPHDVAVDEAPTLDAEFHFEATQAQIVIEVPDIPAAPTGGTAAFAQESDSASTFRQTPKRSANRNLPTEPTAPKQSSKKAAPQRVATNSTSTSQEDRSLESSARTLTMETLESTVQEVVQRVFETQMAQVIQQAIATSMQQQMHGLAVSAKNQRESDVQQMQANSSGRSHEHAANDDSQSGGPAGASANG